MSPIDPTAATRSSTARDDVFELELTVIVVSYNTKELTLECIESLRRETSAVAYELIVVDNASPDGSAKAVAAEYPDVRLLALEENVGFAAANNLAARDARGRRVLLLNPDTVVLDHAVDRLVAFANDHPDRGIVGGRTQFSDGSLNPTSCWARPSLRSVFFQALCLSVLFPKSSFFSPRTMGSWRRDSVREVDVVSGCFLMIDSVLWRSMTGFDETYFMYGEDVDLCLRAARHGPRPLFTPDAIIVHLGGASEPVRADKHVRLLRAQCKTMRAHWSRPAAAAGVALLALGAWNRGTMGKILGLLGSASWEERGRGWRSVWKSRSEWSR